ncbi:MAG TPA: ATP-binding protein [Aliidongia sp.]|uniref:ATP-binding protein n=1 Tax=Aliidongia sp. TaxID=1914230 RepID=UPI002DDC9861|nr:ATP-binding protein [Aliidongia sp.]HEV2678355.1 ATP-binding protein [Aliidongia sp.]
MSPAHSPRRFPALRHLLASAPRGVPPLGGALLGFCAIVGLWIGIFHSLQVEREQALFGAAQNTSNLSRAFEEHIVRSIKAIDQTLLYARDSYAKAPSEFDIAAWAKNIQFLTDLTFQVSLIDKDGIFRGSNLAPATERVDLSDREHFRVQRDRLGDELFISKPVLGRVSSKWSIQMTRKIIAPDGSFDGVFVISLDPQYLSRFYDSVDIGSKGAVALVGTDGIVRARAAAGGAGIGQAILGASLLKAYAVAPAGTYQAVSAIDGIDRVYSYRGVRAYPLIVSVGIAEQEVMAGYVADRRLYFVMGTLLTILLLIVMAIIVRREAGLLNTREKLRASEARYAQKSRLLEATLENMSQGIMMIDADRRVQVCNRRAVEKLGLPPDLMATHPLFDEVLRWQWEQGEFETEGADVDAWLRDFVLTGGISDQPHTYERTRKNGVVLEFRSSPMQDGGMVRTYTDVTQRKETERVLRMARDEADRAARAKSEFLAMMSHEIRSPMNGLLGIIELLGDTKLETEQAHMVELAEESTATLLGIVNDILDLSKIEAGAVALAPEPIAIHEFMRTLIKPFGLSAARKDLDLQNELEAAAPDWIAVDPLRLRQILGNLLGNAIKFTAAGGTVALVVSCRPLPSGAPGLVFEVRDTGIGMAPEVLTRLFQPFSQADASTTKNYGGTGLGLSISRRLARILGGDITVTSKPGQGSIFTLTIPLVPAQPTNKTEQGAFVPISGSSLQNLRVLVAEDQETNRWLVKRQFARIGVPVEVVEDGRKAFAALAEGTFDLLVTDCHMPNMDGVELAQGIRALEAAKGSARLPILGLTADVTAEMRDRCLAAGMDEIAAKPIDLRRLEAVLRQIMARQDGPAEAPAKSGLDADRLFDGSNYLDLFAGDEAEGEEWVAGYLAAATGMIDRLGSDILSGDRAAVRDTAHRLVGSSLTVGALRLGLLARALEHLAMTATPDELRERREQVAAILDVTRDEIGRFIAGRTARVA